MGIFGNNPQLKSCGSIEGSKIVLCPKTLFLGNPQLKSCGSIEGLFTIKSGFFFSDNPQLKSCGSIEGLMTEFPHGHFWQQSATEKLRLHWRFQNCALSQNPVFGQSATEKLRLHWRTVGTHRQTAKFRCNPQLKSCGSIEGIYLGIIQFIKKSIRNWKVAAPLKAKIWLDWLACLHCQSATEKLRLHWRNLKIMVRLTVCMVQSATEKLRLHWRSTILSKISKNCLQSATEKLRLHWRM